MNADTLLSLLTPNLLTLLWTIYQLSKRERKKEIKVKIPNLLPEKHVFKFNGRRGNCTLKWGLGIGCEFNFSLGYLIYLLDIFLFTTQNENYLVMV